MKYPIITLLFLSLCTSARCTESNEVKSKILKNLETHLPKNHKNSSRAIAAAIYHYSTIKNLDPMMMTAIISGESGFNPNAVGSIGEIGFMQLRPCTAKWIANKLKIPWKGAHALSDPIYNIHLGTAYLSYLKQKFSSRGGLLYLAAYNMGEANVLKFMNKNIHPKLYSQHVRRHLTAINAL